MIDESVDEPTAEKVLRAFEDERFTWRTVRGVAAQAGASAAQVLAVIKARRSDFVRSSGTNQRGEDLYATRRHFEARQPTWKRFLGALKNRAD